MNREIKKNSHSKALNTLLMTLLVLLLGGMIISQRINEIGKFITSCGWFGLAVSILLYGVLGASPIPSEPLTVILTSIFGPIAASIAATFGNVLAALVEFYIGGKVGDISHFEARKNSLPWGLNKLPADSPLFLILARMLPGFGPKCISIISGVYQVSFWRYLWTTFVSTLIGAVVVAFGGWKLIGIFTGQ